MSMPQQHVHASMGMQGRIFGAIVMMRSGIPLWSGWLSKPQKLIPTKQLCKTIADVFTVQSNEDSSYLDAGTFAAASTADPAFIVSIICTLGTPETEVLLKARELAHAVSLLFGPQLSELNQMPATEVASALSGSTLLQMMMATPEDFETTGKGIPQPVLQWLGNYAHTDTLHDYFMHKLRTLSSCESAFETLSHCPGFVGAHFVDLAEPGQVLASHWDDGSTVGAGDRSNSGHNVLGRSMSQEIAWVLGGGGTRTGVRDVLRQHTGSVWTMVMKEARNLLAAGADGASRAVSRRYRSDSAGAAVLSPTGAATPTGGPPPIQAVIDLNVVDPGLKVAIYLLRLQQYQAAFVMVYEGGGYGMGGDRDGPWPAHSPSSSFHVSHNPEAAPVEVRVALEAAAEDVHARFPTSLKDLVAQLWPQAPVPQDGDGSGPTPWKQQGQQKQQKQQPETLRGQPKPQAAKGGLTRTHSSLFRSPALGSKDSLAPGGELCTFDRSATPDRWEVSGSSSAGQSSTHDIADSSLQLPDSTRTHSPMARLGSAAQPPAAPANALRKSWADEAAAPVIPYKPPPPPSPQQLQQQQRQEQLQKKKKEAPWWQRMLGLEEEEVEAAMQQEEEEGEEEGMEKGATGLLAHDYPPRQRRSGVSGVPPPQPSSGQPAGWDPGTNKPDTGTNSAKGASSSAQHRGVQGGPAQGQQPNRRTALNLSSSSSSDDGLLEFSSFKYSSNKSPMPLSPASTTVGAAARQEIDHSQPSRADTAHRVLPSSHLPHDRIQHTNRGGGHPTPRALPSPELQAGPGLRAPTHTAAGAAAGEGGAGKGKAAGSGGRMRSALEAIQKSHPVSQAASWAAAALRASQRAMAPSTSPQSTPAAAATDTATAAAAASTTADAGHAATADNSSTNPLAMRQRVAPKPQTQTQTQRDATSSRVLASQASRGTGGVGGLDSGTSSDSSNDPWAGTAYPGGKRPATPPPAAAASPVSPAAAAPAASGAPSSNGGGGGGGVVGGGNRVTASAEWSPEDKLSERSSPDKEKRGGAAPAPDLAPYTHGPPPGLAGRLVPPPSPTPATKPTAAINRGSRDGGAPTGGPAPAAAAARATSPPLQSPVTGSAQQGAGHGPRQGPGFGPIRLPPPPLVQGVNPPPGVEILAPSPTSARQAQQLQQAQPQLQMFTAQALEGQAQAAPGPAMSMSGRDVAYQPGLRQAGSQPQQMLQPQASPAQPAQQQRQQPQQVLLQLQSPQKQPHLLPQQRQEQQQRPQQVVSQHQHQQQPGVQQGPHPPVPASPVLAPSKPSSTPPPPPSHSTSDTGQSSSTPRNKRLSLGPSTASGAAANSGGPVPPAAQGHLRQPSPPPARPAQGSKGVGGSGGRGGGEAVTPTAAAGPARSHKPPSPPALHLEALGLKAGAPPLPSPPPPPGVDRLGVPGRRHTLGPTPSPAPPSRPAPGRPASPNTMRRLSLGPPLLNNPTASPSPRMRVPASASILAAGVGGGGGGEEAQLRSLGAAAAQPKLPVARALDSNTRAVGRSGTKPEGDVHTGTPRARHPSPFSPSSSTTPPTTTPRPQSAPPPTTPAAVPAFIYNPNAPPHPHHPVVGGEVAPGQPYAIWQLFNNQWYQLTSSGVWVQSPRGPPPHGAKPAMAAPEAQPAMQQQPYMHGGGHHMQGSPAQAMGYYGYGSPYTPPPHAAQGTHGPQPPEGRAGAGVLAHDVAAQVWVRLQSYMEGAAAATAAMGVAAGRALPVPVAGAGAMGVMGGVGMVPGMGMMGPAGVMQGWGGASPPPAVAASTKSTPTYSPQPMYPHFQTQPGVVVGQQGMGVATGFGGFGGYGGVGAGGYEAVGGGVGAVVPHSSVTPVPQQPQYYSGPDGNVYCCVGGQWYWVHS